jgi:molybdopterin synthase sulfur carrier subunit
MSTTKTIELAYYALLREQRGLSGEKRATSAMTARELYFELKEEFGFNLQMEDLKVAINGDFADSDMPIHDGDTVVFIPPVTGG